MPETCPQCACEMRSIPVEWRGLVRPITSGDRRNRRDRRAPMSAARAASVEHVGEVKLHYKCDGCGVCVEPGVTHIRSLDRPDTWVEMAEPSKVIRRRRLGDAPKARNHKGRAIKYRQKRVDPVEGPALRAYHRENYRINAELRRKQRRERDARYRERLRNARTSLQAEMRRVANHKDRKERRQNDGQIPG